MSDSLIQLQQLTGFRIPAWFTSQNGLFDDARSSIAAGTLPWDETVGYVGRLFNNLWTPDLTVPTYVADVPANAWVAPAVALQDFAIDAGRCQATGLMFPGVLSDRPLGGIAIYISTSERLIFAATGFYGNLPVTQQDVYVRWSADYGGPFRI